MAKIFGGRGTSVRKHRNEKTRVRSGYLNSRDLRRLELMKKYGRDKDKEVLEAVTTEKLGMI